MSFLQANWYDLQDMGPQAASGAQVSPLIEEFCARHYVACGCAKFGIEQAQFPKIVAAALGTPALAGAESEIRKLLQTLKLEELVLARACAAGNEAAWEQFLNRYRTVLYGAAHKSAKDDATARERADSIYADLYGVSDAGRERASKLLYYSGRGSLEGWLRTVVAQEFVNRYRKTRRETSLEEVMEGGAQFAAAAENHSGPLDSRLDEAAEAALHALDAEDRFVLAAYFLDGRTLAQIAKLLKVHESTISRRVEKTSLELRKRIRKQLVEGGMSTRQAEEAMQDLDVRDLRVRVAESLRQETRGAAFYQGEE